MIQLGHPSQSGILVRSYPTGDAECLVAVKDCIDMAGERSTSGSRALADVEPATEDAEVVQRLREAGYFIAGRANMHELAYGVTGINAWTGTPINPRYPTLIPGGSSSGSAAAVAAGLVEFALGTDTGGSVRVPAACCGVVGFKPTFGRVSRKGVHPEMSSLDCVGVFAREVEIIEKAMSIITGDWARTQAQSERACIGFYAPDRNTAIDAAVQVAAQAAFAADGIDIPSFEVASDAGLTIIGRESWNAVGHLTETGLVGRDVHDRLLASSECSDEQLAQAEEVRAKFSARIDALLEEYEAIALPTLAHSVPTLLEASSGNAPKLITLACRPFNLSGHPAIALPVGEIDGRPISLQLVGQKGADEALCALARQVTLFTKGEG